VKPCFCSLFKQYSVLNHCTVPPPKTGPKASARSSTPPSNLPAPAGTRGVKQHRPTPPPPVMQDTSISTVLLKINFRVSVHLTQLLDLSPRRSLAPSQADSRLQPTQLTPAARTALPRALPKTDLDAPIRHPTGTPSHTSPPQLSPSHPAEPSTKTWFGFKQPSTLLKPLQHRQSKKQMLRNGTGFTVSSCVSHMAYIK